MLIEHFDRQLLSLTTCFHEKNNPSVEIKILLISPTSWEVTWEIRTVFFSA